MIQASVPQQTHNTYDTQMSSIKPIKTNAAIQNLQPDGILVNPGARVIELLEFTRTGDLWPGSLDIARTKKSDKYQTLVTELQQLHPSWTVKLVPFVCGVRSYIDEGAWAEVWSDLGLKEAALKKLIPKVQAWNVEAAKEVLGVRATIKKGDG